MSEAYPLDLNYGHLGKPVYDSERRKWQFSRQSGISKCAILHLSECYMLTRLS